jgi:hypothetical protein
LETLNTEEEKQRHQVGQSLALYARAQASGLENITIAAMSRLWLDIIERWALNTETGQRWVADVCAGVEKQPIQGELFPEKEKE